MKSLFSAAWLSLQVEGVRAAMLTALILILQVMLVMPAFFTGWILDGLVAAEYSLVKTYLGYFFVLIILVLVISPVKAWVAAAFAQRATREQSLRWTEAMLQQPLTRITSQGVGKIHIAIERASLSFEGVVTFLFGQWVPAIVEAVVVFGALFVVLGPLPALVCLVFGLIYFALTFAFQKWKRAYVSRVNDAEDDLAEGFVNVFSKVRTIKAYRALVGAQQLMRRAFGNYAKHAERLGLVSGLISSGQAGYISIGMFGVLTFGLIAFQQNLEWFTAGRFLMSVTLFGMLSASIGKLAGVLAQAVDFEEDLKTLNSLIGQQTDQALLGRDEFEDGGAVVFQQGDTLELANGKVIQMGNEVRLVPGDRILITGESGSGKSSILTAISDKLDRELCVYEVQDPEFIEGSDELGVSNIPLHLVDILQLPKKATLDLNEGSGGEKKRYGVARALRTQRPILIFDEPTSGLNENLKEVVWQLLAQDQKNCVIVSSHDAVPANWQTKQYRLEQNTLKKL